MGIWFISKVPHNFMSERALRRRWITYDYSPTAFHEKGVSAMVFVIELSTPCNFFYHGRLNDTIQRTTSGKKPK